MIELFTFLFVQKAFLTLSTTNWSLYYVPGSVDKAVNRIGKVPTLMELAF